MYVRTSGLLLKRHDHAAAARFRPVSAAHADVLDLCAQNTAAENFPLARHADEKSAPAEN